jgi:ATP synthase protein I
MEKWMAVFRLLGVGWYIATAIGLGLAGGIWLDSVVGTSPLFILLGLGVGLAAALLGVFRMLAAVSGGDEHEERS